MQGCAMCCSMLQCFAVCSSVLQCVAVFAFALSHAWLSPQYVSHDLHVWHWSSTCVTWHAHVWHDAFRYGARLTSMCAAPQSYAWHYSMRDITHMPRKKEMQIKMITTAGISIAFWSQSPISCASGTSKIWIVV